MTTLATEIVLYGGCVVTRPFREIVAAAASAGFDGISLWPVMIRRALERDGLDLSTMRSIVDDAGIRVTELEACDDWISDSGDADAEAPFRAIWSRAEFFEAALVLGADTIAAGHLTGGEIEIEEAVVGFARLCDDAAAHELRVALEFMPFTGIGDLSTGWEVVRRADRDNGGLILDVVHLERGGWDPKLLVSIPPDRILSLQLADAPREAPADLVAESITGRCLPGQGELDLVRVVSKLQEMGVGTRAGPELFRREWRGQTTAEIARELMKSTRNALHRVGSDPAPDPLS
jgi:sugar phosphate isomerase/epimerase